MQKLISVIVPIYNVDKYLERSIESIVFQTYSNLEIILINDGSTDTSGEICDEMARKYNRIRVIHTENEGVARARNVGMNAATGDLIAFADPDDYTHYNMYSIMVPLLETLDVDYVECEYRDVYNDSPIPFIDGYSVEVSPIESVVSCCIKWQKHYSVLWNKVFQRKQIGDIRFPDGRINEDDYFHNILWKRVKKVAYVSAELYYYRQRPGSIMTSKYSRARISGIVAWLERYHLIQAYFPNLKNEALKSYFDNFLDGMSLTAKGGMDYDGSIRNRLRDLMLELYDEMMQCETICDKHKELLLLAKEDFAEFTKINPESYWD